MIDEEYRLFAESRSKVARLNNLKSKEKVIHSGKGLTKLLLNIVMIYNICDTIWTGPGVANWKKRRMQRLDTFISL